ncbi:dihydrofolate reductase family protein [Gordonia sp. ABSL49_1]|uniref:dihydrofolate reductase family protein n=1 Tax=unclassified Gordonia (in: high G+C Gram-positive bacteria) TaxID=2657482 RepID=UPI001F10D719|nr:dihydrofolate reductase family protein [Gordonia sp. ABSL49_1]MCH5643569.1 dihydrofolate reductase family protein [Gordonia sp. ABSL49_1]
MRVVVVNHVSMDGVIQAPGRADEDTRGGFRHGGWASAANDPAAGPAIGAAMGPVMGADFSWLFGMRSYEDMLSHWNAVGGPFKEGLNNTTKYVASSRPDAELAWPNSILVTGDVPAQIAEMRERPGGNLVIMGSGQLIRSLLPRGLVDEMLLMVHPLVLGSGARMFADDADELQRFGLEDVSSAGGVVLLRYQAAAETDAPAS